MTYRGEFQSKDFRRSPRTWWEDVEEASVFEHRKRAAQRGLRLVRLQRRDDEGLHDVWKLGEPVTF